MVYTHKLHFIWLCAYTDLDSNLSNILKQFESTDQQLDKQLDSPDKYITEADIIPLLEMSHSLTQSDDVPYYEFINRHILQLVKSANILELLDIDVKTPPDNLNRSQSKLLSTSVTEESVVKEMVRTSMDNPSPQVKKCIMFMAILFYIHRARLN